MRQKNCKILLKVILVKKIGEFIEYSTRNTILWAKLLAQMQ